MGDREGRGIEIERDFYLHYCINIYLPQTQSWNISTLPSIELDPPTNLTASPGVLSVGSEVLSH